MVSLGSAFVVLSVGQVFGHGAYHDVVAALSAQLQRNPGNAATRYQLAEAHAGHDEWQACLREINIVERLAPGEYPTPYLRGFALHIAGRETEAKAVLDSFLAENPRHTGALTTRGRVLVKLGRPAEAAADLQQAVALAHTPQPDLIAELASAYVKAGQTESALKALDAGLAAAGDVPSLLRCALEIETRAGALDAALLRIDALQKTAPSPEPWMAERARLLARSGRAPEARAAWLALRGHLLAMPNLKRGTPQNAALLAEARQALGESPPAQVVAPPAS